MSSEDKDVKESSQTACHLEEHVEERPFKKVVVGISRPERVAQTLELAACIVPDGLWEELDLLLSPEC